MNKPIFVVGSPRSGTSILTWSLGQHSNILAQEESDWLGRFSLDLEAAYQAGTKRGRRAQLTALGINRDEFFRSFGHAIDNLILRHRAELTRNARELALAAPDSAEILPTFKTERDASDPKRRWVDGTPEYSFYICGLRKLFPEAVFIHLLRDATSVVRSMLHFAIVGGAPLVSNEEEAYDYWLRAVRACVQAEKAYGSGVVYRVRYADLVEQPERVIRSVLDFVQERFEAACLEPLQMRINSSRVPAGFEPPPPRAEKNVITDAEELDRELLNDNNSDAEPCAEAAAGLEAALQKRVHYHQHVSAYHRSALAKIGKLEAEIEACKVAPRQNREGWLARKLRSG